MQVAFSRRSQATARLKQREPQIADQLFVVRLAYRIEVHQLAIEVIQHLHCGRLFVEKNLGASGEGPDIGDMCRE